MIFIVHTAVLFQILVGVYCQIQHDKYFWEHTTSAICFGSYCSHLQALRKRSNEHWSLHLGVGDTYCLCLLLKSWLEVVVSDYSYFNYYIIYYKL
jgi:hypothetical protein